MKKLEEINKRLNITTLTKKLIFIYTPASNHQMMSFISIESNQYRIYVYIGY